MRAQRKRANVRIRMMLMYRFVMCNHYHRVCISLPDVYGSGSCYILCLPLMRVPPRPSIAQRALRDEQSLCERSLTCQVQLCAPTKGTRHTFTRVVSTGNLQTQYAKATLRSYRRTLVAEPYGALERVLRSTEISYLISLKDGVHC